MGEEVGYQNYVSQVKRESVSSSLKELTAKIKQMRKNSNPLCLKEADHGHRDGSKTDCETEIKMPLGEITSMGKNKLPKKGKIILHPTISQLQEIEAKLTTKKQQSENIYPQDGLSN